MTVLEVIDSTFSVIAFVTALAAWLGNLWSKRILNKELETLKSRLKRVENEQSIRLSKLADKQLDIMDEKWTRQNEQLP